MSESKAQNKISKGEQMNINELTIGQAKKEDILGMTERFDYFIHLDEKYLTTTDKYARTECTMLNRLTLVLVCVAMAVVAITAINLCI